MPNTHPIELSSPARLLAFVLTTICFLLTLLPSSASATNYVIPVVRYSGGDKTLNDLQAAQASYLQWTCRQQSFSGCAFDAPPVIAPFDSVNYMWSWKGTYSGTDYGGNFHPGVGISGRYDYYCPSGYVVVNHSSPSPLCKLPNGDPPQPACDKCDARSGNPIILSTRIKEQVETDYRNASGTLEFVRTYRSDRGTWANNLQLGALNFAHPHPEQPRNLCVMDKHPDGTPYCYQFAGRMIANDLWIQRSNGRTLYFGTSGNLAPSADVNDRASIQLDAGGVATGYTVVNAESGATENYDAAGRIQTIMQRNGQSSTYTYSDAATAATIAPRSGLLISVSDSFNNRLEFRYNAAAQMVQLILPAQQVIEYQYDNYGNIAHVVYPDGKQRSYVYNELVNTSNRNEPWRLTGIIDENGTRFATFKYDGNGLAMSTEHADGQDKYQVSYDSTYGGTKVIDPLGTYWTYQFTTILGTQRETAKRGPLASLVSSVYFRTSYDANANIATTTDFNGISTTFTYDLTRNLQTKRVEASGTPLARTTSTEWHASFRLPTRIAEPKRITTFTYDGNGNLLAKTVQATSDANGANGFNAPLLGTTRTWSNTYTSLGQLLTSTGPANDVTSYTYDAAGNTASITNPAGHVTTMSNYDANGRVGRITDPNGLTIDFSYTPRGWLASKSIGSETWTFSYDNAGQLTSLTAPDNSTTSYSYDGAHRLTGISDVAGNTITYTLDGIGNRVAEVAKDPTGALARQTTRAYDALNRLKQLTGGAQ